MAADVRGWRSCAAGPRQSALSLLPRSSVTVAWHLVAVAPGAVPLPPVRVALPAAGARLDASGGRHVFVLPAPVAATAAA